MMRSGVKSLLARARKLNRQDGPIFLTIVGRSGDPPAQGQGPTSRFIDGVTSPCDDRAGLFRGGARRIYWSFPPAAEGHRQRVRRLLHHAGPFRRTPSRSRRRPPIHRHPRQTAGAHATTLKPLRGASANRDGGIWDFLASDDAPHPQVAKRAQTRPEQSPYGKAGGKALQGREGVLSILVLAKTDVAFSAAKLNPVARRIGSRTSSARKLTVGTATLSPIR